MLRATSILPAGEADHLRVIDRVALDAGDRHRRRIVLTAAGGTAFLLDLPHAVALKNGDGLVLESGDIVAVVGIPETLVEIAAPTARDLVRIAWHLGNRHTDVQITGERLRIRRDHVLEAMVAAQGGRLTPLDAPFEPEAGAHGHYPEARANVDDAHAHAHHHGHDHDH